MAGFRHALSVYRDAVHCVWNSKHVSVGGVAIPQPGSWSQYKTSASVHPLHCGRHCWFSGCANEWYNPSAFSEPANGAFGDVRRNSLYGPGTNTVNLSAFKEEFSRFPGRESNSGSASLPPMRSTIPRSQTRPARWQAPLGLGNRTSGALTPNKSVLLMSPDVTQRCSFD